VGHNLSSVYKVRQIDVGAQERKKDKARESGWDTCNKESYQTEE
jgi:hypothetical protein